jgi:hypothetical protein
MSCPIADRRRTCFVKPILTIQRLVPMLPNLNFAPPTKGLTIRNFCEVVSRNRGILPAIDIHISCAEPRRIYMPKPSRNKRALCGEGWYSDRIEPPAADLLLSYKHIESGAIAYITENPAGISVITRTPELA